VDIRFTSKTNKLVLGQSKTVISARIARINLIIIIYLWRLYW